MSRLFSLNTVSHVKEPGIHGESLMPVPILKAANVQDKLGSS